METFTELKKLVRNPHFREQRRQSLSILTDDMIDKPIVDIVNGFNKLPYCFTLQSCYGHFVCNGQEDAHNLGSLTLKGPNDKVAYRIAYIALCIDDNFLGRELLDELKAIPAVDPDNVQLCCAEWFWKRQVNSYALQVEPDRYKGRDTAILGCEEAFYVEKIRDELFIKLHGLLEKAKRR